jgi:hypothetical protein
LKIVLQASYLFLNSKHKAPKIQKVDGCGRTSLSSGYENEKRFSFP